MGADGVTFVPEGSQGIEFQPCGNPSNGGLGLAAVSQATGHSQWRLAAPSGAVIDDVEANRVFEAWNHAAEWILIGNGAFESVRATDTPPASGVIDIPIDGPFLAGILQCPGKCEKAGSTVVTMKEVVAHMEDLSPPEDLRLTGGSLKRGTVEIPFEAKDRGAGIAKATLLIDGRERAALADDNEGHCVKPYKLMTPCKTQIKSSFSLDTSGLSPGSHEAKLAVEDGSGQVATTTASISVAQPPADTTPPVLNGVSLLRRRFRVGAKPGRATSRSAGHRGTVLRLTSSEPAQISMTIERASRRRGFKPLGRLSADVGAGSARLAVSGRIGARQRPLRPGSYRMAITATDAAGNVSKTVRRPFRILPG